MAALEDIEDFVREKVKSKCTHKQLSNHLKEVFPGQRGFSVRSIERFCAEKEITKTTAIDDEDLDSILSEAVSQVGPTYGRKMMTGLLSSQGIHVSQQRIRNSLCIVSSAYQDARRTATARQTNPVPYHADYFGHKIHVDQNEKLTMFGVTHVAAVDGFSNMIVGFITMPVKNNVEIYANLYCPIVMKYGLWDQIRVDQGKEWILMLFVQESLAHFRQNSTRPPHLQGTSKQNHCIERLWVEVNTRVNYPIKVCLIALEEAADIDMDCSHVQYCVSWFSIRVANVGTTILVEAWNNHPIPGTNKGTPLHQMESNNGAVLIDLALLLEPEKAVEDYEATGGQLTIFNSFGEDPLRHNCDLVMQREAQFYQQYPDFTQFFYTVANGDHFLFREGLIFLIGISKQLETQL